MCGADVRRVETTACDRPRRSRKTQLLLPIAVVAVAFVMIHVRMLSRRVVSGHLETDDFVMIACGVSTTLPTYHHSSCQFVRTGARAGHIGSNY